MTAKRIKVTVSNPQVVDRKTGKSATRTVVVPVSKLNKVESEARIRGQEIKRYQPA